ncbi:hypothetical protein OAH21_01085 [bacterium]|nr:hypothetical protein [bacterium]
MDDWMDSVNDGLKEDAGLLGAMGGMAALNNQRASLNKLSEIKNELAKAQASAAKTEKERLAIEKKRLALEQAHLEEQKNTAEAVKELRILMADADTLLERISQIAAPSSGGDSYDLDLTRTAGLIQVKLELVEQNSAVLSDLADLKEQRRLKTQFEIKLSEFVGLKRLPENPLSFVEKEVFDQLQQIWSAFGPIEKLSNERALKGEGGLKALDSTGYLLSEAKLLNLKKRLTKALERLDQVEIQSGVAGRFTKNHFEESKTLWGQFYFLKGKRPDYDFSGSVHYLKRLIDEPQFKEEMEGIGVEAIATIESHITCARDQGALLRDAVNRISLGDFDLARSVEQTPKAERYANALFAENHDRLVELDKHRYCFLSKYDFSNLSAADLSSLSRKIQEAWDILGVESWSDRSDLKQRISKNKKIVLGAISKKQRRAWIFGIGACVVAIGVLIWGFIYDRSKHAKKIAEVSAERKAAEVSAERKAAEVGAWGANRLKQCDVPSDLTDVVGIAAGRDHSLALKKDGTVVAWGYSYERQCDVPSGLTDVVGIAAGDHHSLALKKDGIVVAWGNNRDTQCNVPSDLTDVVGIAAGKYHSLALKKDGTVVAWGHNENKQCDVPSDLTDIMGIAAGDYHSLALKKDGTVVVWGSNLFKQCDVPSGLTDIMGIAAGYYHSLDLNKDGTVVAWGDNGFKQCDVPSDLTDVVGIAAGKYHSLALKKDGTVVAWGNNDNKQCDVPSGLTDVVGIAAGYGHSIALKKAKKN